MAVVAQVILAVVGLAAVAVAICSPQAFQLRVHPAQIPAVIGLGLAAVAVHEFAHALVVVHYRRRVDAAGLRLHLGVPAFYVQAAGALLLTRRQRLIQAAAGAWAEWLFTAAAAIMLWLAPWPAAAPIMHRFVLLNAATIASNLAPFTGLDGSWLLADTLRVPDLAHRSRGSVSRLIIALAGKAPVTAGDWLLAGYRTLNGIVAVGPATRQLAATIPQLASLDPHQLGVLAGHLQRTRPRGTSLDHLTGYGMVHTGALAATTPAGNPVILTPGATWLPGHRLHQATSRRTILITMDTSAVDSASAGLEGRSVPLPRRGGG